MKLIILFVLAMVITVFQSVSGQAVCGDTFGTNHTQLGANAMAQRFYFNVECPAVCSGTVSSFTYCYYRPNNVNNSSDYTFNFAVYRKTSSGNYENVSSAFVVSRRGSSLSSFNCSQYTPSEQVTVEPEDVLGACIFKPSGSSKRISIIGRQTANLSMLLRSSDRLTSCHANSVPPNITISSLSGAFNRVLHLYANIVPNPPTTATTIATTNAMTTVESVPSTTEAAIIDSTTSGQTSPASIPTDTSVSETTTSEDTQTSVNTSSQSTDAASESTGPEASTVAPVVVVLLVVVAATVVSVMIIVLWFRRQRQMKNSYPLAGIDNVIYGADNGVGCEYVDIGYKQDTSQQRLELQCEQSNEHTYELEGSGVSNSAKFHDYTYAEVGLFNENKVEEHIYTSPLDAPVINYTSLMEKNKEEDIYEKENPYQVPATREEIYQQLKTLGVKCLDIKDVEVMGHLGSGQFGSVDRGQWKRSGTQPVDVALKTLNNTDSENRLKFLQEAATMAQFRHPNVILLHGVVSQGDPMMLIVEIAMKGDLRNFLLAMKPERNLEYYNACHQEKVKSCDPDSGPNAGELIIKIPKDVYATPGQHPGELVPSNTPNMMLQFSQHIALGMQYLSAKGFIHRDVAARNVLVSATNICKISDFGMSRDLADESYYMSHGGMIPVKWTAPEAIHYKKYSTASDVWAYGCLLYEIWSIGHKPFEGLSNMNTLSVVDSGKRLSPPPGCPKIIYELMILCWNPEYSLRPSFRDILLTLVGSKKMVLNIPMEDSSTHSQAGVLGAPLEAGENMYTDLQKRYSIP